jgi:hypothetical protein
LLVHLRAVWEEGCTCCPGRSAQTKSHRSGTYVTVELQATLQHPMYSTTARQLRANSSGGVQDMWVAGVPAHTAGLSETNTLQATSCCSSSAKCTKPTWLVNWTYVEGATIAGACATNLRPSNHTCPPIHSVC